MNFAQCRMAGRGWRKTVSWVLVVVMLLALSALTGCGSQSAGTGLDAGVVELKLAHFWPSTHPVETQLIQPWANEINQVSNGKVRITSYPGETLLKANDIYDGVVKGVADIGVSCFAYTRGRFPVLEVFELPGIIYESSEVSSKVAWESIQSINPKEVQDTRLMMVFTTGPGNLYTKTAVNRLEDLQGMEIRATGLSAKTLSALGAIPVGMAQSEAYEALSKGVVKGNLGPDEVLQGWKQAEVTSFLTKTPFLYNTLFFVTMNKEQWEALGPELQQAITQVNQKYFEEVAAGLWDQQNEAALKWAVEDKGMQVIELSPEESQRWISLVEPIQQEYVKNIAGIGVNGEEILDKVKALAAEYNSGL
ncbi:MAG: TRAP transporter substrate-binding protein [Syntrophomonadaceae bacterium]|jgi:TRAP-type C4-dicarboxylate transport system substrate-binding protein